MWLWKVSVHIRLKFSVCNVRNHLQFVEKIRVFSFYVTVCGVIVEVKMAGQVLESETVSGKIWQF